MAPQTWHTAWVRQKCDIAGRLARGEAGAGYAEAVILLCAAVSALSAETWPGTGKDRARFVELLVRFGSFRDVCMTLSVPLLVQDLQTLAWDSEATALRSAAALPDSARVLTGADVDRPEADVLAVCPSLEVSYVRKFSYAALLYQEVRSSYAHEYKAGASADPMPMTMATGQAASYVNQLREPTLTRIDRAIHFHVPWIVDLAGALAAAVDSTASLPLPEPPVWWIKGG